MMDRVAGASRAALVLGVMALIGGCSARRSNTVTEVPQTALEVGECAVQFAHEAGYPVAVNYSDGQLPRSRSSVRPPGVSGARARAMAKGERLAVSVRWNADQSAAWATAELWGQRVADSSGESETRQRRSYRLEHVQRVVESRQHPVVQAIEAQCRVGDPG